MTSTEKEKFDSLNQSSYLLRVQLDRQGLDVQMVELLNDTVWHVVYRETVVGTITFRTDVEGFTYCNIRLYKHLKQKLKDVKDFIMSEYFEFKDGKRVFFRSDKFEKYFKVIKDAIDQDLPKEVTTPVEQPEIQCSVEDSISRLTEYCDEYDQNFTKNMIIHDIMNVIRENERLHSELQKKSESIMKVFLNT